MAMYINILVKLERDLFCISFSHTEKLVKKKGWEGKSRFNSIQ